MDFLPKAEPNCLEVTGLMSVFCKHLILPHVPPATFDGLLYLLPSSEFHLQDATAAWLQLFWCHVSAALQTGGCDQGTLTMLDTQDSISLSVLLLVQRRSRFHGSD